MPAIHLHRFSIIGVLCAPSPGEVLRRRPGVLSTHGDTQNNLPALLLHPFSGNATRASQGGSEPVGQVFGMEPVVLPALALRVTLAALFNYTESAQNYVCV